MKKIRMVAILMSTIAICLIILGMKDADIKLEKRLIGMSDKISSIQTEVQNIQKNYISIEALQPVLDDLAAYQDETDRMRNNLNDFNKLWI